MKSLPYILTTGFVVATLIRVTHLQAAMDVVHCDVHMRYSVRLEGLVQLYKYKGYARMKAAEFVFLRSMRMNCYWQGKALWQIVNCYRFLLVERGEDI